MSTTSTADSKEGGVPDRPVLERGAVGPGGTRTAVKGQVAPRLPHERDESSDSGTAAPSDLMHKAAKDLESGKTDEPRGPAAQRRYSELTKEAIDQSKPARRRKG